MDYHELNDFSDRDAQLKLFNFLDLLKIRSANAVMNGHTPYITDLQILLWAIS
jgi:hypothetical protein